MTYIGLNGAQVKLSKGKELGDYTAIGITFKNIFEEDNKENTENRTPGKKAARRVRRTSVSEGNFKEVSSFGDYSHDEVIEKIKKTFTNGR